MIQTLAFAVMQLQSLVKFSNSRVRLSVTKVLSHPCKRKLLNDGLIYPVQGVKENSKFYNYEIWQSHLAAQKADRLIHPNSDRSSTINQLPYATKVKIFENVENYHEAPPKDSPP